MELIERCRVFAYEKQVLESNCPGLTRGELVSLCEYPIIINDSQNRPLSEEDIKVFKDNLKKDFYLMLSQYSREEIEEMLWVFIHYEK